MGAEMASLRIDLAVYRLAAVKKAAYRFSNFATAAIELDGGHAVVVLTQAGEHAGDLQQAFLREVLDQELREVVADETAPVRNLILAQVFSRTNLLDPVGEEADFREDPLGITAPESK